MDRPPPTKLRTRATEATLRIQDHGQMVGRVLEAIEGGLAETLGEDAEVALRMCLKPTFALSEPVAYALGLDVILGSEKAERALREVVKRLHDLEKELKPAGWNEFSESIAALRGRYSLETLHDAK